LEIQGLMAQCHTPSDWELLKLIDELAKAMEDEDEGTIGEATGTDL
jgi:hypothetical protein